MPETKPGTTPKVTLLTADEVEDQGLVFDADDTLIMRADLERLLRIAEWAAKAHAWLLDIANERGAVGHQQDCRAQGFPVGEDGSCDCGLTALLAEIEEPQ